MLKELIVDICLTYFYKEFVLVSTFFKRVIFIFSFLNRMLALITFVVFFKVIVAIFAVLPLVFNVVLQLITIKEYLCCVEFPYPVFEQHLVVFLFKAVILS